MIAAGFCFMKKSTQKDPIPRWFVVNMCGGRWQERVIGRMAKPTLLFHTLAEAYAYAVQMAEQHNAGDYAIFECIGRVASNPENEPGSRGLKIPTAKQDAEAYLASTGAAVTAKTES